MADLLTHYVSSRVAGIGIGRPERALVFSLGVFLPDLVGKALGALPFMPDYFEAPTHTPLGLIPLCWAASLLFVPDFRRAAFGMLYVGSLLHLAVDILKNYLGRGATLLLYPFSLHATEFGIYRSEDVFIFLPANIGILLILWGLKGDRLKVAGNSHR